jgi:hypothetical protein
MNFVSQKKPLRHKERKGKERSCYFGVRNFSISYHRIYLTMQETDKKGRQKDASILVFFNITVKHEEASK